MANPTQSVLFLLLQPICYLLLYLLFSILFKNMGKDLLAFWSSRQKNAVLHIAPCDLHMYNRLCKAVLLPLLIISLLLSHNIGGPLEAFPPAICVHFLLLVTFHLWLSFLNIYHMREKLGVASLNFFIAEMIYIRSQCIRLLTIQFFSVSISWAEVLKVFWISMGKAMI